MNILISGYGRMGKAVEQVAKNRGHNIVAISDKVADFQPENVPNDTVVIDFSQPEVAADNILSYLKSGLKVVVGTTGWYSRFKEVEAACKKENGALLYGTNMSIGMNVMFMINKQLSAALDKFGGYTASIEEIHHVHKLDAPSGTAITLAEGVIEQTKNLDNWSLDKKKSENLLPITAKRIGEVPGTHEVVFSSDIDKISLRHEAFSRKGFSQGAVMAAEWLENRSGIFTIQDMILAID